MCIGGRNSAPPVSAPPAPVVNASPIGDYLAPELRTADDVRDEDARKKKVRKRGTKSLNTMLLSGLNIPTSSSGVNVA